MSVRASTPEDRFEAYLQRLGRVIGHADRLEPLRGYLTGLLLSGERKSVEPMAAKLDPTHVRARHQSLHHRGAHLLGEDPLAHRARLPGTDNPRLKARGSILA
jgi:SRSO17 transposase